MLRGQTKLQLIAPPPLPATPAFRDSLQDIPAGDSTWPGWVTNWPCMEENPNRLPPQCICGENSQPELTGHIYIYVCIYTHTPWSRLILIPLMEIHIENLKRQFLMPFRKTKTVTTLLKTSTFYQVDILKIFFRKKSLVYDRIMSKGLKQELTDNLETFCFLVCGKQEIMNRILSSLKCTFLLTPSLWGGFRAEWWLLLTHQALSERAIVTDRGHGVYEK